MQEALEGTDAGVFDDLLAFARQSHRPPTTADAAAGAAGAVAQPAHLGGCQRLPTGLVLAGGVNSADHCRTFPSLAEHLRKAGCYVALLQPAGFGKSPGEAAGEILRQLSGLKDSKAEHMDALVQWYQDETGAALASGAGAGAAAGAGEGGNAGTGARAAGGSSTRASAAAAKQQQQQQEGGDAGEQLPIEMTRILSEDDFRRIR